MNRYRLLLIAFLFCGPLVAQQLGVSASVIGAVPKYVPLYYNSRVVSHTAKFCPGIRLEGNYILPGYSIPVSGFNGIGFSYFFPVTDSAVISPTMTNGSSYGPLLATHKTTVTEFSLRFGYEIPQEFNDFLLLHIGWGLGMIRGKTVDIIPDRSATFPFDPSDFETPAPLIERTILFQVIGGAVYEFEKFSLMGQYSLSFGFDGKIAGSGLRHELTVGIFYPLKRF